MFERTLVLTYTAALLVMLAIFMYERWFVPTAVFSAMTLVLGLSKIPIRWVVPRPIRLWVRLRCWSVRNRVYRVRRKLELF